MSVLELRDAVCRANQALPKAGLVTMHSGNVSAWDPASNMVFIKPSGVDYETLTPEELVAVDLETGAVVDSNARPSVDLPHLLYL